MTATSPVTVRDATVHDVPSLLELYESSGLDQPGDNNPAQAVSHWSELRKAGAQVLIAEDRDGRPLGTLTLFILPLLAHRAAPAALVEDVAVHPSAQGCGLGRRLVHEAMERAQAAGCYKLALSSNERREASHAFYDSLGFQRHGFSFVAALGGAR
ncbi:GNAT family N-acetyltransferase [Aquabacterium sp. A7-Y]|uniref:GNAT family N-acetyltransferase n=1 Tax=Aquabacterium sp. A7-Y TaxID=1349605 RepID=UPI00223D3C87|nr:GNAT family N-acetyltransferase [Aquabacterium sp. A7-Y]MCW7541335.1 GNAT family N-acetyltransferase [Aquabacterium sp. A7-Y]